jgi:uncharacterized membrane protein (UPF0127 family)
VSRRRYFGPGYLGVVLLALVLVSCSAPSGSADPAPNAPPAATPPTAARAVPELPSAVLPDGFAITLELAITPEEIGQGLMFRPSLPSDRGMLFLFEVERVPSFWMKNTMIPLDLLFLDRQGAIVEIIHNAQPCAAEPCPHYIPSAAAAAVLEVAAGVAARHELAAGDVIAFERVPGYPRAE